MQISVAKQVLSLFYLKKNFLRVLPEDRCFFQYLENKKINDLDTNCYCELTFELQVLPKPVNHLLAPVISHQMCIRAAK